jgi:aminoglycoside 3-N-acetyltransferase
MEREVTSFRVLVGALRDLNVERGRPIIAHASLSAFGKVNGGAETLLGALLASFGRVMMPTFTYKTMLVPEAGPADNALDYGSGRDMNRMAEFFHPDLPADRLMGAVAEALRNSSLARRSTHPILSFAGIGVEPELEAQNLAEPLAPIGRLHEAGGWVILLGVDHTVNTSIHYAERLAGRVGFLRWALTPEGVVGCPGFPGCSQGFQAIESDLEGVIRNAYVGPVAIWAVALADLVERTVSRLARDPLALLCASDSCSRCQAVRGARKKAG